MNTNDIIIAVSAVAFVWSIILLYQHRQVQQARKNGLWPPAGQVPTIEDVERLAKSGERILAIKLYRQIHPANLKDAKDIVEKLAA